MPFSRLVRGQTKPKGVIACSSLAFENCAHARGLAKAVKLIFCAVVAPEAVHWSALIKLSLDSFNSQEDILSIIKKKHQTHGHYRKKPAILLCNHLVLLQTAFHIFTQLPPLVPPFDKISISFHEPLSISVSEKEKETSPINANPRPISSHSIQIRTNNKKSYRTRLRHLTQK